MLFSCFSTHYIFFSAIMLFCNDFFLLARLIENQIPIYIYEYYLGYICRRQKKGQWIGKRGKEPFLHEEIANEECEQKPADSTYIIFTDLLKSCVSKVISQLLVKYLLTFCDMFQALS